MWITTLALLGTVAHAGQTTWDVEKGATSWRFSYAWEDADGARHDLAFELPAGAVQDDRAETTGLVKRELYEHAAREVRTWGKSVDGVELKARAEGGQVVIEATGAPAVAAMAMKEAERVRDEAIEAWLADHDYTRIRGGQISFDHAKLVAAYADELAPVAEALSTRASDPRQFAELALSFVQSIPYEVMKKNGDDPGYRRPLALLSRNRGDCDSKAVLYLGLIRAAHPEVDLSVVYVPGHALTGVGLPKERGDRTFSTDGHKFLYAEPVGPAMHALGQTDPRNKKAAKSGEVRAVPDAG